ncbi:type I-G CRISPR-associated protein, Cas3-extension family [Sorangium sp. So ce204]|uniref:type I-G CRISPR-associated protein, Cas3-extension family n=1 Tax=Sorangium sp. So ce204 TaxID=3133288 RepID=UPI003F61C3C5
MTELLLTGLDGKNPLSFLAALGVLNALADRTKDGTPEPRLVWRAGGTYQPAIVGGPDRGALLDVLVQDLESFRGEPAIERLRYRKDGDGAEAHDLKPPPGYFAHYLNRLVSDDLRRSLAFAAAFATDVAVDNNGNTKPTALHFSAGNQAFLAMVSALIQGVHIDDLEEALFGPWRYERPLPVLQWDNTSTRDYALRASAPASDKKLGVPGADWLAFRGLPFIRVVPVGDRIVTTCCNGEWKTGAFRWPIWTVPLPRSVIGSVLTSPEVFEVDPHVLRARGIAIVFESAIRRSDQGGYGSFAPARMARPARGD